MTAAIKSQAATRRGPSRSRARPLARYRDAYGAPREILTRVRVDGALLVIDCASGTHLDPRLVGRVERDEPRGNAALLAHLYLDDGHPRCRRLRRSDLRPTAAAPPERRVCGWREHESLRAGDATSFELRELPPTIAGRAGELAWTRTRDGEPADTYEVVTLREVVGTLEAYEPARSLTEAALSECAGQRRYSASRLASELRRLNESATVLNRSLREAVHARLRSGEASLSSIAVACGQVKRDHRGKISGETSWLARRIGAAPDAPGCAPTPWVHTDVLARIARDGLGLAPHEIEVQ